MIKKFISFFTAFILILGLTLNINANIYANEKQGITYDEFKQAQEDGYIGEEITYEEWNNIISLNNQLEETLENSNDFHKIYDSSEDISMYATNVNSIPSLRKGDIIISNGTSSFGLTGHSGIAISENDILHIVGIGYTPDIISRERFYSNYIKKSSDWIKIYRPNVYLYGSKAANWAERVYRYSNATYKINTDIYSTNETYCSKIVFQAYKFGANAEDAFNWTYDSDTGYEGNGYYITFGIIAPYNLSSLIKSDYVYKVD